MLPVRQSLPSPRRRPAIAVEIRVPAFGLWFADVAANVRADALFVPIVHDVPLGTRVTVEMKVAGGPRVVAFGVVADHPLDGIGLEIAFHDLDENTRAELESLGPVSEVRARVA